ncbi:MAG: hypothetical protein ACLPJJ_06075 [Acidocella sp.]|uniref:hypothetical protein n=1 Tax=Acidocella sp. TaxID=50710 RepID=UPI003FBD4BC3
MNLPQAVIVHGLVDIRAALAPGRPVTLLSAPGAALYAGGLWWRELLAAADYAGPALLDCGPAPGRAWEALKLGLRGVVLAPCPAWDQVAEYAAAQGALLLPAPPPALDFCSPGAARRLEAWLAANF